MKGLLRGLAWMRIGGRGGWACWEKRERGVGRIREDEDGAEERKLVVSDPIGGMESGDSSHGRNVKQASCDLNRRTGRIGNS